MKVKVKQHRTTIKQMGSSHCGLVYNAEKDDYREKGKNWGSVLTSRNEGARK